MARRVSAISENLTEQLDWDLAECRWFSIQFDESVDSTSTAQLMMFIQMVFNDFSTEEEVLTLLPLKTTTRGIDIYNAVKTQCREDVLHGEKGTIRKAGVGDERGDSRHDGTACRLHSAM